MGEPGWYNDDTDPALARWHDGERWTEHTLVKAAWDGPGAPPPPVDPQPTAWVPVDRVEPPAAAPSTPPPAAAPPPAATPPGSAPPPAATPPGAAARLRIRSLTDRYLAWPRWARIAAPVAVGVLAIAAVTSSAAEDDEPRVETSAAREAGDDLPTVEEASAAAVEGLGGDVSTARMASLVGHLCDGSRPRAATALTAITRDADEQLRVLQAAGDAAEDACPATTRAAPALLNDVYAAAATTTTTAAADAASVAATPSTRPAAGAAPSGTTPGPRASAPAGPAATQPPATQAPPATQPPVTQPPATQPPATQPSGNVVNAGSYCSPEGATGVESAGTPMTCATTKCDGTPYEQARWRRTNC